MPIRIRRPRTSSRSAVAHRDDPGRSARPRCAVWSFEVDDEWTLVEFSIEHASSAGDGRRRVAAPLHVVEAGERLAAGGAMPGSAKWRIIGACPTTGDEPMTSTDFSGTAAPARRRGRRCREGRPQDAILEKLVDKVGGKASVKAVFGEPIVRGGKTVVPVAKIRWGFGGGGGPGRPRRRERSPDRVRLRRRRRRDRRADRLSRDRRGGCRVPADRSALSQPALPDRGWHHLGPDRPRVRPPDPGLTPAAALLGTRRARRAPLSDGLAPQRDVPVNQRCGECYHASGPSSRPRWTVPTLRSR